MGFPIIIGTGVVALVVGRELERRYGKTIKTLIENGEEALKDLSEEARVATSAATEKLKTAAEEFLVTADRAMQKGEEFFRQELKKARKNTAKKHAKKSTKTTKPQRPAAPRKPKK